MQRRGILLEEVPLPRMITDVMTMNEDQQSLQIPEMDQPIAQSPSFSISELTQKLEGKTDEELGAVVTDALRKSGSSLVKTLGSAIGLTSDVISSDDFNRSKRAANLGFSALQDAFEGIGDAYVSFGNEWKSLQENLPEEGVESPQYLSSMSTELKRISDSSDIKASLSSVSKSTGKTVEEYSTAAKVLLTAIGDRMSKSTNWTRSSSELGDALKVLLVSTTILGSRTVRNVIERSDRLLPPSSS